MSVSALIADLARAGRDPVAIRRVLAEHGKMKATKYDGAPRDVVSIRGAGTESWRLPMHSKSTPRRGSRPLRAGDIVGRWTVLAELPKDPKLHRRVLVRCACGTEASRSESSLTSGHSKSCGCLSRERGAANRKHGESWSGRGTTEYTRWKLIRARTRNPKHRQFPRYGGRGIGMCPEWESSYEAFLRDVGRCPGPGYTIDRIDNNRGYEPGNVRWATFKQQNRNRHNTPFLTVSGITRPLMEWSEVTGLSYSCLRRRRQLGWPEELLFAPSRQDKRP